MIRYKQIRTDLKTKGWTIVDTKKFFLNDPFEAFGPSSDNEDYRWKLQFSDVEYKIWLENLIEKTLPDENLIFEQFSKRYHVPGKNHEFCSWHADGGNIRTIARISGRSTQFKHENKILTIPLKHTLIFTGKWRQGTIPPTLHRTPLNIKFPRKLIVGTFKEK